MPRCIRASRPHFRFFSLAKIDVTDGEMISAPPQTSGSDPVILAPLTGKNRDGKTYKRPHKVEQQIREILSLSPQEILARADTLDHEAPEHIAEESLVYLIRHYHAQGDAKTVGEIGRRLLKRCAKRINSHLATLDVETRQLAHADATNDILKGILDLESSRGDFFQVRFWVAVDRRAITAYSGYVQELQRAAKHLRLSDLAGEDGGFDEEESSPRASTLGEGVFAQGLSPDQSAMLQVALGSIPEPYRTAYVLRYGEGWQIESKDPEEPTISAFLEKTPRTINTWIREAERHLAIWKEGHE